MSTINTYFDGLKALMEETQKTQAEAMEQAARRIADCFRNGGMLYTFGTGHGHLLALEIFYRAGGMARVCPILDEKLMLHISAAGSTLEERREEWVDILLERYPIKAGDVLISISNSGRNAVPVLLAKEAQKRGAFVIALTSMKHTTAVTSRNSLNLRLFETADLVIDNGGILGDASVSFADGSMVGATSTAVGAAILQAIVCRVKELALEENFEADFFKSSNVDGGDEWNNRLVERYREIIPGLL
ncbi:MAG: SIS domain-containing protein [Clostridiales bacterium]|nr:SIS domain-containing protein [Clostridiales bacterium]